MKLNVTVNSGMAYLLSLVAVVTYAFAKSSPFSEFWIAVSALYGWHTGRRLWRQLKTPGGVEVMNDDPNGEQK